MGQAARITKLLLDLSRRDQGGANTHKRRYLEETVKLLDAARHFYLEFFLAHPEKVLERLRVISAKTGEVKEVLISADKLLTWAEFQTVETDAHPADGPPGLPGDRPAEGGDPRACQRGGDVGARPDLDRAAVNHEGDHLRHARPLDSNGRGGRAPRG